MIQNLEVNSPRYADKMTKSIGQTSKYLHRSCSSVVGIRTIASAHLVSLRNHWTSINHAKCPLLICLPIVVVVACCKDYFRKVSDTAKMVVELEEDHGLLLGKCVEGAKVAVR